MMLKVVFLTNMDKVNVTKCHCVYLSLLREVVKHLCALVVFLFINTRRRWVFLFLRGCLYGPVYPGTFFTRVKLWLASCEIPMLTEIAFTWTRDVWGLNKWFSTSTSDKLFPYKRDIFFYPGRKCSREESLTRVDFPHINTPLNRCLDHVIPWALGFIDNLFYMVPR